MTADVRVYVPTLRGGAPLERCLESLAGQSRPAEVVVVDNGGVVAERDDVRVVRPGRNLGFGPAINAGVRTHPARSLVFANDDAAYGPRFVEALLDAGPVAAGVLALGHRPEVIDSAGVVVDSTLLAFDHLCGEPVAAARTAAAPLGPTGAGALVGHEAFSAVGGFDERVFAYLDDVDLALRLRGAGWRTRLAPDALAVHEHSATLGAGSAGKHALMGFSRGYLLRRYGVLRGGRAPRALLSEAVLVAGAAVNDRTLAGLPARARGFHAARGLPRHDVPADASLRLSLREALARRRAQRTARGTI